jgi:ceroid-lipofuscinosis MFS transporter 7
MTEKIPVFFVVGMCLWYLATGMEYGLILPTINDYIKSTGAPASTIGLALTYFALSGLVSSPLIGWLTDRQKSLKVSFVFSLLCSIIGYAAYTFFQSASMILVGRLISGIGWGVDGAIIGRVSLATGKKSGTFIGVCLLSRQVGIILAGLLNFLWISNWAVFSIFGFEINPNNSAGFACIIIYLVFGAVCVVSLKDEPKCSNDDDVVSEETSVMLEEAQTEKHKQYKYKQVF